MSTRATGIALAFVSAVISGVSIYVNGLAVKHFPRRDRLHDREERRRRCAAARCCWPQRARARRGRVCRRGAPRGSPLLVVAIIGGSVPFVLFFEGLAPARGHAGGVHPEDARGLGRAAGRAAPARALRLAARARHRAADRRAGVARRQRRTSRIRQRRGDDPRRDAAVGGRGRLRQAAARTASTHRSSPPPGWRSARCCCSHGCCITGKAISYEPERPAVALGCCSPGCC